MRIAVVVAPRGDNATAEDRLRALRERLMRGGFNVLAIATSPQLARDLDRATDGVDDADALLVYVLGEAAMRGEGLALRVADDAWLAVDAIGALVRARAPREALVAIDGWIAGADGDAMIAAEHVDAAIASLGARAHGIEALVAMHGSEAPSWPFTRFFAQALDGLEPPVTAARAFARMKEHPELATSVPAYAHVKGRRDGADFAIAVVPPPPPSRSSLPPSTPRPPRSIVPLPAIEPILADAERAHAKRRFDEALDGYKKALMVLADAQPAARASIYASIAEVKLAQGRMREAEMNFEKALASDPRHPRSLTALAALAADAREWTRAAGYARRLAAQASDDDARGAILVQTADLLEQQARDPRAALPLLEEARQARPRDTAILARLRAAYEARGAWREVAGVIEAQVDAAALLHDRAELRFQHADVLLGRLRDEARGVAILEGALEDDPTHARALAALAAVRARREEWSALERFLVHLVELLAHHHDPTHAYEVCKRLASIRRDRLRDPAGAIEALEGALGLRPGDVDAHAAIAELLASIGDEPGAIAHLEAAARIEPTRAATHRRLFDLHRRTGETDRAWLAASALEALGATTVDHDVLLEQFRDPPRPTAALDDAAWRLLRAPGWDDAAGDVLAAIAPAAASARVAELRARGGLVPLDPARREDPSSTASIARAFGAASRVLAVALPDLYVLDDVPGGLAAVQARAPSTAIGPEVTRGVSAQALAFLAARHLAYYRPEHYALVFYPTLAELTALFVAAVALARPETTQSSGVAGAAKLRGDLDAHVTPEARGALTSAVARLHARAQTRVDLAALIRSVELSAARAGLLACGDLAIARAVVLAEWRTVAGLTADERAADLLAFTASRELATLRTRIGVAARASLPPAPPSSPRAVAMHPFG